MESLTFRHTTARPLAGTVPSAITGVVASGNLEILLERVLPPDTCEVAIECLSFAVYRYACHK